MPNNFIKCLEATSYLDLYGLTPYQFRLFAHVARRSQKNDCTSSLEKMALVCRMGTRTAQDALSELLKNSMIQKKARYNKTSLLRVVNDVERWTLPKEAWQKKDMLAPNLLGERKRAFEQYIREQESLLTDLKKKKKAIFVHGYLDLYGLDPYEFRVLAHVSCNNLSLGSVERIAAICMMSPRKVQTTLKRLLELNLISKEERKGAPNDYQINTLQDWQEPVPDWANKRTVARLKNYGKHGKLISEESINLLESYQSGLEEYYQQLSEEFAKIISSIKEGQKDSPNAVPSSSSPSSLPASYTQLDLKMDFPERRYNPYSEKL